MGVAIQRGTTGERGRIQAVIILNTVNRKMEWHVWGTTVPVGGTHGGAVAPRRLIPEPDLGLKFDGMLFVVTRRELWYLNVEIKNLA